jgi:hypothetical protein
MAELQKSMRCGAEETADLAVDHHHNNDDSYDYDDYDDADVRRQSAEW